MDSRDIIISFALEYDLPTLLNYCRTSKRINDLVCNNNLFWVSKLKKEFDISHNLKAKEYYKDLTLQLSKYSNMNELYYNAIANGRLDLVKIALDRGADINYSVTSYPPLLRAFIFQQDKVFDYLLERGIINSRNVAISNIFKLVNYFAETGNKENQLRLATFLFEKVFPTVYHLSNFSAVWKGALQFLERNRPVIPEVYDKHIEKIRTLAME